MAHSRQLRQRIRQRGAVLLLFMLVGLILGVGLFLDFSPAADRTGRNALTTDALAQAKAALIGYALTYRDTHPNESYGYLPCPDTNNNGEAEGKCGDKDVSVIGRLPWKTLGLPPLRDGSGECLWYAVSGVAKNSNPKTDIYNWDTVGQFIIQDKSGNMLAGATPHAQPLAIIFAAGPPLDTRARIGAGGNECGGSNDAADYLDGVGALDTGITTVTLATADSLSDGTNNDRAVWITSQEIFGPIKRRADFKADVDALLNDLAIHLNTLTPAALPAATGSKGMAALATSYLATDPPARKISLFSNWQDNLLYAKPGAPSTVNGETGCNAILLFGGERTASGQSRATTAERDSSGNYLEAPLATLFPAAGAYAGSSDYLAASPATDLVRCIKGLTPPAVQTSFATDFASFAPAGAAGAATVNPVAQTASFQDASGSVGGCLWHANAVPLAGRTLRAHYTFQFSRADPAGGPDLGNGFTLQLTRGDLGPPDGCGAEDDNGALGPTATGGAPGTWGYFSFIVETDIRRNPSRSDPNGNHTAIMKNGKVKHADFGVAASTACNGSRNLCEHAADKFEESPTPAAHNQRLEIVTGCDPGCGTCTPTPLGHADPNTYAKVSVWVDCTNCSDVAINLDRVAQAPTVEICSALDASMNTVFFGFTGSFASGTLQNSVTVRDFVLRSE
ncbi:MAG: hypothetical protein HYU78_15670 [Rhodocyclales bacterium]|nr:hypothetical protein [Rhodocyclales bacterium]